MKSRDKGISLMELLVTIGIIIALVGILMPAISAIRNNSVNTKTSAEMTQLDNALIAFFTDNGRFPSSRQMLTSLSDKYFSFDNSRTEGSNYKDPWGKSYIYMCPGIISSKGYDLFSLGLLVSQKNREALGRLISALSSTIFTSEDEITIKIGEPAGLSDKTIWGLSEPEYDDLIKAMINLLRSTDVGYELAVMINIANIPIELADLSCTNALALYDPDTHEIYVDITYALNGPIEVVTAFLAHEATHLADHLYSGDMDFDSIEEEYDAFYNGAMVWDELTENKTFENLSDFSNAAVTTEDNWLEVMKSGEETAKEILRQYYPDLPEEDQWGDSYVVAKEY